MPHQREVVLLFKTNLICCLKVLTIWTSPHFCHFVKDLILYQTTKFKTGSNWKHMQMKNSFLGLVENIVGKGQNDGYQHFLRFPQCFQKTSRTGSLKVTIMW